MAAILAKMPPPSSSGKWQSCDMVAASGKRRGRSRDLWILHPRIGKAAVAAANLSDLIIVPHVPHARRSQPPDTLGMVELAGRT